MSRWKISLLPVSAALMLGTIAWTASTAQSQQDDRPRFDPAEMQKRMLERMKTSLGASDEDWKALSPKIEKVMAAQRDSSRGGGMGGFFAGGGRGGRGGDGGGQGGAGAGGGGRRPDDAPTTPIGKAASELRTALDDKATSADDIGKKLSAYRDVRSKAREELAKAQKDLRELLSQRQEASLVLSGMLD